MSEIRKLLNQLADELEKLYPDGELNKGVEDKSPTEDTKKWLLYPVTSVVKVAYQNNPGGLKLPIYKVGFQEGIFRTYQSDGFGGLVNRGKNFYDRADIIIIGHTDKEDLKTSLADRTTGDGGLVPDSSAYIIPRA